MAESVDSRQQSIVFQNAMRHAIAIKIHNAGAEPVDIKEIIDLAKRIAIVSLNPQLEQVVQAIKENK